MKSLYLLVYFGTKTRAKFGGTCLKQDKTTYTHGTIVNIYIVYDFFDAIGSFSFPLKNSLF